MNGVQVQIPNIAITGAADSISTGIAAVAGASDAPGVAEAPVWNHASNAPVSQPAHSLSASTATVTVAAIFAITAIFALRHKAANAANARASDPIPTRSTPSAGAPHAPGAPGLSD